MSFDPSIPPSAGSPPRSPRASSRGPGPAGLALAVLFLGFLGWSAWRDERGGYDFASASPWMDTTFAATPAGDSGAVAPVSGFAPVVPSAAAAESAAAPAPAPPEAPAADPLAWDATAARGTYRIDFPSGWSVEDEEMDRATQRTASSGGARVTVLVQDLVSAEKVDSLLARARETGLPLERAQAVTWLRARTTTQDMSPPERDELLRPFLEILARSFPEATVTERGTRTLGGRTAVYLRADFPRRRLLGRTRELPAVIYALMSEGRLYMVVGVTTRDPDAMDPIQRAIDSFALT